MALKGFDLADSIQLIFFCHMMLQGVTCRNIPKLVQSPLSKSFVESLTLLKYDCMEKLGSIRRPTHDATKFYFLLRA